MNQFNCILLQLCKLFKKKYPSINDILENTEIKKCKPDKSSWNNDVQSSED